jgi:hypothetical protein
MKFMKHFKRAAQAIEALEPLCRSPWLSDLTFIVQEYWI